MRSDTGSFQVIDILYTSTDNVNIKDSNTAPVGTCIVYFQLVLAYNPCIVSLSCWAHRVPLEFNVVANVHPADVDDKCRRFVENGGFS